MKLTEILKLMDEESKKGFINIDDWRIQDAEHLLEMGFKMTDDYRMSTDAKPHITIYKKRNVQENNTSNDNMSGRNKNNQETYFYLEEKDKPTCRFKEFDDIIEYFAKYPDIDDNKK